MGLIRSSTGGKLEESSRLLFPLTMRAISPQIHHRSSQDGMYVWTDQRRSSHCVIICRPCRVSNARTVIPKESSRQGTGEHPYGAHYRPHVLQGLSGHLDADGYGASLRGNAPTMLYACGQSPGCR
jgi:hypothetical protein